MLQRIYFFPHCSKPCLQIFCKSIIIKSQKKYQGGKVYSVFIHTTVAKVIKKSTQCYDMAQACTVWDRAFNIWQTLQNIPPLLMRVVHAIAVENPSTHQLTVLCKHCVLTAVLATDVFREYTTPHILVLTIMKCSIPPHISPISSWHLRPESCIPNCSCKPLTVEDWIQFHTLHVGFVMDEVAVGQLLLTVLCLSLLVSVCQCSYS